MRNWYEIREAEALSKKAEKHRSWLPFDTLRHPSSHSSEIRDGTDSVVEGDRVIMYIHGELTLRSRPRAAVLSGGREPPDPGCQR